MITLFAVGGIVLTFIGSFILVVAAVRVPRFLQLPEFQFGHMRRVEELRTAMRRGYGNYPEEEREKAYAAAEVRYNEEKLKVEQEIARDFYADRNQAVKTNMLGILLIAAGSVAQGVAVLMAAS